MNVTSLFPVRDSLDDSGCRRVNADFNRDILRDMSTDALDSHIADLEEERVLKSKALKRTLEAQDLAVQERLRRG